jgi:DNA-binding transcriptional LysR family regulator
MAMNDTGELGRIGAIETTPMHRSKSITALPPSRAYPPFPALRAFDAVARLGGVRKAADALAIHHSAISRHLRLVEDWTGATLVVRSGRGVTLTEEGWRYHAKLSRALDMLAEATLGFVRSQPHRTLVVWSRPGVALDWLVPRLDALRAVLPEMQLEIRPTHVGPDFALREADLFIQYRSNFDPDPDHSALLRTLEFVRSPIIPLASPGYLASRPPIREPGDLLHHPLVDDEEEDAWRRWFASFGLEAGAHWAGPRFCGPQLALDAARRGHGILLSTEFLARADIDAGRLVEVGTEGRFDAGMTGSYWLTGRSDHWDRPSAARFREWLCRMTAIGCENLLLR